MADRPPRYDLVAHIREQIEAGTYLSTRRVELTADIILKQIRAGTFPKRKAEGVDSLTERTKPE